MNSLSLNRWIVSFEGECHVYLSELRVECVLVNERFVEHSDQKECEGTSDCCALLPVELACVRLGNFIDFNRCEECVLPDLLVHRLILEKLQRSCDGVSEAWRVVMLECEATALL